MDNEFTLSKEEFAESMKSTKELARKEYELKKVRIEVQHEKLQKQSAEIEAFKNFKIEASEKRINNLKFQNREYIDMAKKGAVFLGIEDFVGLVPLFPRNIILVGAETGSGKSSLTANLTLQFLAQNRKVLVITNEEHPTDVLNRVICLNKGWSYYDHTAITPEQQDEFDRLYPIISQKLDIIDDNYNGVGGLTTTLEGISTILESLKRDKAEGSDPYGVILIDYYQNISTSNKNPGMEGFKVLEEVAKMFDTFKSNYNAPLIVLSQLKPSSSEDTPFKDRIEGRKSILNVATCAIEAKAIKEESKTEWIFRKSRFARAMGRMVKTGFDKGKYVPWTGDFARKIEMENLQRNQDELLKKTRQADADKLKKLMEIGETV